jgi:hypothetical protein
MYDRGTIAHASAAALRLGTLGQPSENRCKARQALRTRHRQDGSAELAGRCHSVANLLKIHPKRLGRQNASDKLRVEKPSLDDQFEGMPAEGVGWAVRRQGRLRGA